MRILILDNYDSFVYNIAQYIGELGAEPIVIRNDAIDMAGIDNMSLSGIIISPGPGSPTVPRDVGVCNEVIEKMGGKVPILGVCLGHQAIAHVFGGKIILAKRIMHGKTSEIEHDGKCLFKGIESPMKVMRYHSLVADQETFPVSQLEINARTIEDDEIFSIQHREYPIFGVQFHPESIGTEFGKQILRNYLEVCNAE